MFDCLCFLILSSYAVLQTEVKMEIRLPLLWFISRQHYFHDILKDDVLSFIYIFPYILLTFSHVRFS